MSIYDFNVLGADGKIVSLSEYKNKVILIINSATQCGFTPQYDQLQDIYEKFENEGFIILDFPCNQFGNQAPGSNEEIVTFCDAKFGITFPIFSKIDVNGECADPLYKYLISQQGFKGFDEDHPLTTILKSQMERNNPDYMNQPDIKWNFTKFLVDRDGNVVDRFEPTKDMYLVEKEIERIL